ncbi:jg27874 [Pararge aegeria aegeria]|uniref:Jg27874 protein n=1 Tax=Pararge aegeria aegeria TaxID=348720 RepID=A0A8S4RWY2_9NEOP|nr:jg27874 [Pararge aegeria aegeria]
MVGSYLEDRYIKVRDNTRREKMIKVCCGVPQGSILGPTLWNILYDGVFKIKHEEGVKLVGFADDLALVVVAKTEKTLVPRTNTALERLNGWMRAKKLSLAPEKTEAIVFSGRRKTL